MLKKIICIFLIFLFSFSIADAKEKIKLRADMQTDFILKEATKDVIFKTQKEIKFNEDFSIPKNSTVYAQNIQAQRERRWHKSGYIILKVLKYTPDENSNPVDISDKEIYLVARKYEKIDKKEATILATELIVMQAASVFAPGVDILYFFTKGAIQRKKDPNWFKAGVSNAYENSICWFWLKGKPIDLVIGDEVNLKGIEVEKAQKLKVQISKRKYKEDMRALKKDLKKEYKIVKKEELKEIKAIKKELKREQKEEYLEANQKEQDSFSQNKIITIEDVRAAVKISDLSDETAEYQNEDKIKKSFFRKRNRKNQSE